MKKSYSYLTLPPRESVARTYELARQMIPVLISWAQEKRSPQYYGTLSKAIGFGTARISKPLGVIGRIFKQLREESGENVPYLNALIINQETKRPSDGLDEVMVGYEKLSEDKKREFALKANKKAYEYDKWPWVLSALGLMPYKGNPSEKSIRKGLYNKKESESTYHKALKEYIFNNPNEFSIDEFKSKKIEHILLSGDRLDVYFLLKNGKQIAIEVKSRISNDADILRGIYQCVKYKAVLTAECQAHGQKANVDAFLIIENEMSEDNRKTANMLSVKYLVYEKLK